MDRPQVENHCYKGFSGFWHFKPSSYFKPGQAEHLEPWDTTFLAKHLTV